MIKNARALFLLIAVVILVVVPISAIQPNVEFVDNMASNNTPAGYIAIATTTRDNNEALYGAWRLFDGNLATVYESDLPNNITGWVQIKIPNGRVAKMYNISFPTGEPVNRAPRNWTFEASNDNATWVILDSETSQVFAAPETKSFPNTVWTGGITSTAYTYYRLNVTAINGGVQLWELVELSMYTNFTASLASNKTYGNPLNSTFGNPPITIQFNDTSDNAPTSWNWSFGDGTYSTLQNPIHAFSTRGIYNVSLTSTFDIVGGSNTTPNNTVYLQRSAVVIGDSIARGLAYGRIDQIMGPDPFWNNSYLPANGGTSYDSEMQYNHTAFSLWDWRYNMGLGGDSAQGVRARWLRDALANNIHLTDTLPDSTLDNKTPSAIILQVGINDLISNRNLTTVEANISSCVFDANNNGIPIIVINIFPNASRIANVTSINAWEMATFRNNASVPQVRLVDAYSFLNGTDGNIKSPYNTGDFIHISSAGYVDLTSKIYNENIDIFTFTNGPPIASFTANKTSGVKPLAVMFNGTSTNLTYGPTMSWYWDFGDGGVSFERNMTYTYPIAGNYTVQFTATNSYGSNTTTQNITVYDTAPPNLVADFSASNTAPALLESVTFSDLSTGSPTTWNWSFGDGTNSTLQNPSHAYSSTGLKTVFLTVQNVTGSSNTTTKVNYINVTTNGTASINTQDIVMAAAYNLVITVTATDTGLPIPGVTITDQSNQTVLTDGVGIGTLTESYSTVTGTLVATGYVSRAFSIVVDNDTWVTYQMTPSPVAPQQNVWWTPHIVQVTLMDASYGNRLTNVNVTGRFNESSMPVNWLNDLYGIQTTASTEMINKSLYLQGITGSDGTITFTMLGSLRYDIYLTAPQYGLNNYYVTAFPSDSMLNIYVITSTGILPTQKNSTYVGLNQTRVYFYEPDINNVTMCVDYKDDTGMTQSVRVNWTFMNNNTIANTTLLVPGTTLNTVCYTLRNVRGTQIWWGWNSSRLTG